MNSIDVLSPFSLEPIRTLEQFFGRENETHRALDLLRRGECVSVVGPAKIGKTSLLAHVMQSAIREPYGLARDCLFVYLDCHQLFDCDQDQCCRLILEETIHQAKNAITIDEASADEFERSIRGLDSQTFYFKWRALLRTAHMRNVKLIIVLDDYEFLAKNTRLDDEFFSILRSLATSGHVAYLVTSQWHLDSLERDRTTSPFWNIFTYITLRLLTPEECQQLVTTALARASIEFPLFVRDWIIELGRGEPYRLQKAGDAAFQMWQEHGGSLKAEDHDELKERL